MKFIRLIIAGILLTFSVFAIIKLSVSLGVLVILLSGIFVLLHFKNENNLLAFYLVRKNKSEAATKVLNKVKHPENMIKSQEAYYYYLLGLSTVHKAPLKAEKHFKKALSTGLRTKTDQALAKLNLAASALSQRNKKLATHYITECKKLDKNKMLHAQIKEVEAMMKRI